MRTSSVVLRLGSELLKYIRMTALPRRWLPIRTCSASRRRCEPETRTPIRSGICRMCIPARFPPRPPSSWHGQDDLEHYLTTVVQASADHPILVDGYLTGAVEIDVDAVSDGEEVVIGGIMEHIEEAGVHSGDSACSLPPYSLGRSYLDEIRRITRMLALELKVKGLMNLQLALKDGEISVLEVNPRASRTIPFVSKAIGKPLAKIGALVMAGKSLKEMGFTKEIIPDHVSVKEAVFPFIKFHGVDVVLGPEMKSTGEVMGVDKEFGLAYLKAQDGTGFSSASRGQGVSQCGRPGQKGRRHCGQTYSGLRIFFVCTQAGLPMR